MALAWPRRGLPVVRRQHLLKTYRLADRDELTEWFPCGRTIQRRLPPAV